jgi:hypothetical protein
MRPPTLTALVCRSSRARRSRRRGAVDLVVIGAVVAVLAVGAWLFKPRKLDGESRRADASAAASAQVEAAVATAVAAEQAKGATVAASVVQIGIAAADAPASPQSEYIRREAAWVAPLLPPPDPAALLAAERRRLAVVEGRLDEARRLYADADKERAAQIARAERSEAATAEAFAARRAADTALAEAAAANLALERRSRLQWAGIGLLAVIAVALWVTGLSPAKVGRAIGKIRAGEAPGEAFDDVVPLWLRDRVQTGARLAVPSIDPKQ